MHGAGGELSVGVRFAFQLAAVRRDGGDWHYSFWTTRPSAYAMTTLPERREAAESPTPIRKPTRVNMESQFGTIVSKWDTGGGRMSDGRSALEAPRDLVRFLRDCLENTADDGDRARCEIHLLGLGKRGYLLRVSSRLLAR
jgi:hypothetical protein